MRQPVMRILKREMTENEKNELNSVINSYYVLMEAADMLLRRGQTIFNNFGQDVNGPMKMRHRRMMQYMESLKNTQETFFKDYDCFGKDERYMAKYDMLRDAASYIARLTLLIGDRSCREDEKRVRQNIWDYIYYMPEQGLIADEALDKLKIR